VLGLVEHVAEVEPREAMLGVEPSEGVLEDEDDHDHDHDEPGHTH